MNFTKTLFELVVFDFTLLRLTMYKAAGLDKTRLDVLAIVLFEKNILL